MNLKEQVKTLHFWAALIGSIIGVLLAKNVIPPGQLHTVLESLMSVLGPATVFKAAAWQAPVAPLPPPPPAGDANA